MHIRTATPNDAASIEHLMGRAYPILLVQSYDVIVLAAVLPAMTTAT